MEKDIKIKTIKTLITDIPKENTPPEGEIAKESRKDFSDLFNKSPELNLLRDKVKEILKEKIGDEMDISESQINQLTIFIKNEIDINPNQTISDLIVFHKITNELIKSGIELRLLKIEKSKKNLLKKYENEFNGDFKDWNNNKYIEDDEFKNLIRVGDKNSTTYFDTAQFGVFNRERSYDATNIMLGSNSEDFFDEYISVLKKEVLEEFKEPLAGNEFKERGISFPGGGGRAFKELFSSYIRNSKNPPTVLVTSEEYGEFITMMKGSNVNIITLPDYKDKESYANAIKDEYKKHKIDFVLASPITRRGTKIPIDLFNKNKIDKDTMVIVDGCQSEGRCTVNRAGCDVYFASFHKAQELGGNCGILALSENFIDKHGHKIVSVGTRAANPIARTTIGISPGFARFFPNELNENRKNLKEALVEDEHEKQNRMMDLAEKFVDINKYFPEINILRPANFNDKSELTGIFEVEIGKGIKKKELCKFLFNEYGIHIAEKYFDPITKNSLRISMHPYLNDDSIKLLFFAIREFLNK